MTVTIALNSSVDDFVARLSEAAYQVALRHGLRSSFEVIELELWQVIRQTCHENAVLLPAGAAAAR